MMKYFIDCVKMGNFWKGYLPCAFRAVIVNSFGFYVYQYAHNNYKNIFKNISINVGIMSDKSNLDELSTTKKNFDEILNTLSSFKSQITMLSNLVRPLQKNVNKQMRVLEREAKNTEVAKSLRKQSAF